MMENIKQDIQDLRIKSNAAFISSVNEDGFPQTKCMLVLERDDMKVQWFSTNLSSKHAQHFIKNPKASVYYCDEAQYKAALFTGLMEVCTDHGTKAFLWQEGFEIYYPKGVDDEDYCVLKFTSDTVNYYHGISNKTISIEEL